MARPLTRIALTAACAALALGQSGCFNKQAEHHEAADEGVYLDAGSLIYQVQLSRELNPYNDEDADYLTGLPAATAQPGGDQEWFGVWLQVRNPTSHAVQAGSRFKITDTQGNVYRPLPLGPANVFAYRARVLAANGHIPTVDSPAAQGPVVGSLLLFKINTDAYQNRPLTLDILGSRSQVQASVKLDL